MSKGNIGSNPEFPAFSSVCLGPLDEKAGGNQEKVQTWIGLGGERKDARSCSPGKGCPTAIVVLTSAVVILSVAVISLLVLVVGLRSEMIEFQTQLDDLRNDKLRADEKALTCGSQPPGHPSDVQNFSYVLRRNVRSLKEKRQSQNGASKKTKKNRKKTSKKSSELEIELKKYCERQFKNSCSKQALTSGSQPSERPSAVHHVSDVLRRNIRSLRDGRQSQNGAPKKPKRNRKKTSKKNSERELELKRYCDTHFKNSCGKQALTVGSQPSGHPSAVRHFPDVLRRNIRSLTDGQQSQNDATKKPKKKKKKPPTPKKSSEVEAEMKKYCDTQIKNASGKQLDTIEFEGSFYSNYNTNFFSKTEECKTDTENDCEICRSASIKYHKKYAPLHVYQLRNTSTDGSKLIKTLNKTSFEVVTPGSYLLHLDIVMMDKHMNHSIGVFINSKVVLACPRGGFLMPQKGHDDIVQFRMCNIDGMVNLKVNDKVEIKTMEPHTVVRLVPEEKSLFKLILLHPPMDPPPQAGK